MENTVKPRGRPGRKPSQLKQAMPLPETPVVLAADTPSTTEMAPATPASHSMDRPSMRPPLREDSRAAAARRTDEILQRLGGSFEVNQDEFAAPPAPDGWVYEYKQKSVLGQEDHGRYARMLDTGWEHVPASRHPELMPGQKDAAIVERKGMYLMQRPATIQEMAQKQDQKNARDQMRQKSQQLSEAPAGHFERNHPAVRPRVSSDFSSIAVPGDK
jgi:hypothetical protein